MLNEVASGIGSSCDYVGHCILKFTCILCVPDEMGLGKTVELLACILAHRASNETTMKVMEKVNHVRERLKKYKRDRVECICGATQEDDFYEGSWIQCDHCDAWQHALCVGYATPKDPDANLRRIAAQAKQVKRDEKVRLGKLLHLPLLKLVNESCVLTPWVILLPHLV